VTGKQEHVHFGCTWHIAWPILLLNDDDVPYRDLYLYAIGVLYECCFCTMAFLCEEGQVVLQARVVASNLMRRTVLARSPLIHVTLIPRRRKMWDNKQRAETSKLLIVDGSGHYRHVSLVERDEPRAFEFGLAPCAQVCKAISRRVVRSRTTT